MTLSTTAIPVSSSVSATKKQKIHVFFCAPSEKAGVYNVLGNQADPSTAKELDSLSVGGGMFECVSFQNGANPEAMEKDLLSVDKGYQDELRSGYDLYFFCKRAYKHIVTQHLTAVKDVFSRELVLHAGDDIVGWCADSGDGYACGSAK